MSKLLESNDFGPQGFRWLTLKRILVNTKKEPLIILEAQYRPSQDAIVVEVPAGLIDQGEDAAQAAVRELKEETGYSGRVTSVSEPCFSDPGMTNSNMQWAVVEVDPDAVENADVKPELEPGEFIEVFLVPFQGLHKTLLELKAERGWQLDARLLAYAWGLQHSQDWNLGRDSPS